MTKHNEREPEYTLEIPDDLTGEERQKKIWEALEIIGVSEIKKIFKGLGITKVKDKAAITRNIAWYKDPFSPGTILLVYKPEGKISAGKILVKIESDARTSYFKEAGGS